MLVHHKVTPQHYIAGTHLYTRSKVSCLRKQHYGSDQAQTADHQIGSPTGQPLDHCPSTIVLGWIQDFAEGGRGGGLVTQWSPSCIYSTSLHFHYLMGVGGLQPPQPSSWVPPPPPILFLCLNFLLPTNSLNTY